MNTIIFDHMVSCIDKKELYENVKEMIEGGAPATRACYMSVPTCINPNYYFIGDDLVKDGCCIGVDVGIVDADDNVPVFHGGYHIYFDTPIPMS